MNFVKDQSCTPASVLSHAGYAGRLADVLSAWQQWLQPGWLRLRDFCGSHPAVSKAV